MTTIPWTADQVEAMFHAALGAGDIEGVDAALRVLLTLDTRRAIQLYDELCDAMVIVNWLRGGDGG